ncbi:RecQ-mediated genome instability protein 1 [Orchesella cincta]|uniref:RecQ-mediated genome instability protein 1 n=1 Tax=Orchesella cincta TaxID=48709 RepID=A0A1D2NMN4_ORCCI|nr:RecQ-mediated genome instability protein 1 [Orchesella cincta]
MGISDLELRTLKKFMKDSGFTYTDEWLLACVEWICDNFTTVNGEVLKREIIEQWKDVNLEHLESSCLPANLKDQRVVKLPEKYGLQVNSVRDIGESSYSQWNKVKKLENENASVAATDSTEYTQTWQPTPKRCLYLNMTDGSQEVFGLEMQLTPGLSINMKPGTKVIVTGPVDCRRGVIHLKPSNIRVIGGEVEDIKDSNKMERILASILNITDDKVTQTQPRPRDPPRTRTQPVEVVGDFPNSADPFNEQEDGLFTDDDIFMEIDEDALLQSATTSNVTTQAISSSSRTIMDRTTQRIEESFTPRASFTEEIEDFDDDEPPPPPAAMTSRSALTSARPSANVSRPIKPSFMPPPTVPKAPTSATSITKQSDSTTTTSSRNPAPVAKPSVVGPSAFRSSKTAVSSKSTASTGKQKNILQYLTPMPVVIDPPTPERQTKRRKKSTEDAEIKVEISEETSLQETEFVPLEDYQNDADAISLMQIVDEAIESRLAADNKLEAAQHSPAPPKAYPVRVSERPYVFLMQVQEKYDELAEKRKIVYIKACICTVVSNIQVDNGCWTLSVCINDGTGYLNCKINSNILDNIIGFTPQEMKRIKATKTAEGKAKISEGIGELAKKLVHMNAIFAIELGEQPLIIELSDIMLHHSTATKDRLNQLHE